MTPARVSVPLADLYAQYLAIRAEVDAAVAEVIRTSAFIRGPFVETFEREFADVCGLQHAVSCANGTDALYIAMRALDVGPGDEVIVPAHSWISTSATVTQAGGAVVFCDTDEDTFTIDPRLLEGLITPRTVGIIPVHLYGQPADMDAIMSIAARHRLWVIEDCAQAHLARYHDRNVGTIGTVATFSFYPGKNLGAMGDAGAVATGDAALAERMAMFARHGGLTKGDHQIEGINSRMDGLQAAVLSVKLRHLTRWTALRREIAAEYVRDLAGVAGLTLPREAPGRQHVYHLFVVQHERREQLAHHLAACGVQTAVNYPVALPFLPAYRRLAYTPASFPVAYRHQSRILSLPIFPEMTTEQRSAVVAGIRAFAADRA
ncbi:MAG TPA: DegT/DnrJ/EryC1/StrS family aminotransferase [Steroidobacteraceae bacterium]